MNTHTHAHPLPFLPSYPSLPSLPQTQVDSLSRLRSLLAASFADVSGEPLDISTLQIEIEDLDGAGFVILESSKAMRRGRLQQARSLRASAAVDAAAPSKTGRVAARQFRV